MKNKNNSLFQSALRIHKNAFVSLVEHGLKQAAGFKTQVNGFGLLLNSITAEDTQIRMGEVEQRFLVEAELEKAQGWMPFKVDTQLLVTWSWTLKIENGYPAIQINDLSVETHKKTKIGFLKLNLDVPNLIENKVFKEIAERKLQIQEVANKQIRKSCNALFKKEFILPISGHASPKHPSVSIKRWQWEGKIVEDAIECDLKITMHLHWLREEKPNYVFQINKAYLENENKFSLVRIPVPFDEITTRMNKMVIPVRDKRTIRLADPKLEHKSESQIILSSGIDGDFEGSLTCLIAIRKKRISDFEISDLNLTFKNKLLNLGSSLFERQIEKKIQLKLEEQFTTFRSQAVDQLNNFIVQWADFIQINDRPLRMDDFQIKFDVLQQEVVMVTRSDFFGTIELKKINTDLLTQI